MASFSMRVTDQRLLPGCSAGLSERTALVDIALSGNPDAGFEERIRDIASRICPDEPLFRVTDSDWPTAFLADPGTDGGLQWRLGQWVVALTVAVQRWGRDPAWRGRVLSADSERLRLALPWRREQLINDGVRFAALLVERSAGQFVDSAAVNGLTEQFTANLDAIRAGGLPPNTLRFLQAADARDIPWDVLSNYVQLGWGANAERMDSSFTGRTSFLASKRASQKILTKHHLNALGVPVPRGGVAAGVEEAVALAGEIGWPVVVKPADREQGTGVTPNVGDVVSLHHAVDAAQRLSPGRVIVEKHIEGDDHRLLVVHGRLIAAARRVPGGITGDGVHTVEQLVERLNRDPRRGDSPKSLMRRLALDAEALECLLEQRVKIASVPERGRWIRLRRTANIASGGSSADVLAVVHPDNRMLAERAVRIMGLDIGGVDLITPDISRSWREVGGAICEINAQPGFRPHWIAEPERDINGEIIDMMFAGRSPLIPTTAITGTNGKSTTALMLNTIWTSTGRVSGVCTTHESRIGAEVFTERNLSGYPGARIILNDPGVQAAVLEVPRKGMVIFGHPCARYDVGVLLNVSDDHLGLLGVDSVEQMAELKSEVLQRARCAVVVNGDDQLCLAMLSRAGASRHILVTRDPAAPHISEHLSRGGEAVGIRLRADSRWITVIAAEHETDIVAVDDIPATMSGLIGFNETNAMFAAAAAWAHGLDAEAIAAGLRSFGRGAAANAGRFQLIDGLPFQLVVDYAHNPAGVEAVCAAVSALPVGGRRILGSVNVATRHRGHASMVAPHLAATFDQVVVGCDPKRVRESPDYSGADPARSMVDTLAAAVVDAGLSPDQVIAETDQRAAIGAALSAAGPGDLVVLLGEPGVLSAMVDEFIASRNRPPRH